MLLAQNHDVTAITTTPAKADKLNQFYSPIQDDEIESFFAEARNGERELSLHTTTDKAAAYGNADLVIIATPTNYDDVGQFFDIRDLLPLTAECGLGGSVDGTPEESEEFFLDAAAIHRQQQMDRILETKLSAAGEIPAGIDRKL